MPLDERESARAAELRTVIDDLGPEVRDRRQRTSDRAQRSRQAGQELALQAASQAIGTLAAAGVAYLVAVAAGVLEGTDPLTIVVAAILGAGLLASLWTARWLILPSHRAQMRLASARLELTAIQVRAKLRDGEALTMEEAQLIQFGLIRLDEPD